MDEFGLLTERFGLKPQGKAAPMASSKRSTNVGSSQTGTFGVNLGLNAKPYNYGSKSPAGNSNFDYDSFHNNHNGTFQSNGKKKTQNFGGLDNGFDIFNEINKPASHLNVGNGGMFDYDSIFSGSNKSVSASSSSHAYVDDIFGGMLESKIDDVFPVFVSPPKQSVPVDDLLDKIDGLGVKSKSTNMKGSEGFAKRAADFEELVPGFGKSSDFDELIPGFGKNSSLNNRRATTEMNKPRKSTVASHDDPILIFETASSAVSSESFPDPLEQISKYSNSRGAGGNSKNTPPLKSPPKPATRVSTSNNVHDSVVSSIDELEDFAMGRVHNNASKRSNIHTGETAQKSATNTSRSKEAPNSARANQSNGMDDLESFFGMGSRSSSVPKSRTTTLNHIFDGQMQHKARHEAPQRQPSRSSASMNKSSMMTSFDDLSLIFDEASNSSVFQEVEGETEERRKARLGRYQRTQERAARAVADMNQRDLQTKMEQDERRRIAEIVDVEIKRWAAGKEGNMRALLSTLQHVLWPECGWQPVSLTDMITSGSVKKVYRKATLFVHPDKVQQKGASLKEKYTAEKVFDILKEAWNKFNAEELS